MDTNGLYDIYGAWHVPFWQTTWFYCVLGALLLGLVLVVGLLVVRWYAAKKHLLTPWQKAFNALDAVQQLVTADKIGGKDCYFMLTEIIKEYLQKRYDMPTIGKTDEELLQYLAQSTYADSLLPALEQLCAGCRMIKFANAATVRESMQQDLERMRALVERTRPQE